MGLLFDGPPADPTAILTHLENRLGDIAESLAEIAAGLHMMGANQARAMRGEAAAYNADDFGFDLLIANESDPPQEQSSEQETSDAQL